MPAAARTDDLTGLIRSMGWVAGLAFATGFCGWLAIALPAYTAG